MITIKPIELPDIPSGGGLITDINLQKKDPDRCSLFLDAAFAFGVHVDVVLESGIKKGDRLSESQCEDLVQKDVYFKAMKRCLSFLSYRPRSNYEIEQRLKKLAVSEEIGAQIVEKLQAMGYLDDLSFARQWVESRSRSKGFGPFRLGQELMKKGISSEVASSVIETAYSEEQVRAQLKVQLEAALRRYRREKDANAKKRKIIGFLTRRGFQTSDIIEEIKLSSES